MNPILSRRKSESSLPLISDSTLPASSTFPSVGLSNPEMMLRKVVLPDPDGPTSAVNSPDLIVKSIPLRALIGIPSGS